MQTQNKPNLNSAWLYLFIFAPLQTILALCSNSQAFFGNSYFLIDTILRSSLIILPIVWFFTVDKKKFQPKLPAKQEVKSGLIIGLIFAIVILLGYYLVLKPNFHFDTGTYKYFSKEIFIIFGLFIAFFNAFSEEFNYRYMIFTKLKDIKLANFQASLFTGFIFSIHHVLLVVPLAGIWLGALTFIVLTTVSYIWSYLYQKYNSLYSPYIIHVLADLALFVVGFDALFLS